MNLNHALNVRSDFSLGESMLQVKNAAKKLKEQGYESAALVDTMTLSSMVDFSGACKKEEIRPIVGVRIRVVEDPTYRKPAKASGEVEKKNPIYYLKAFPTSLAGVTSLMKLLSKANSDEYFYYHARVGLEDVLALEDCLITTGDIYGLFSSARAGEWLYRLIGAHGLNNVYIEMCPIDTPYYDRVNDMAMKSAEREGCHVLATYPMLYEENEHAPTLEVLGTITGNSKMSDPWRSIQHTQDFGINTPIELAKKVVDAASRMDKRYGDPICKRIWHEALKTIEPFAKRCSYTFEKREVCLPKMAENEFAELMAQVKDGWSGRIDKHVLGYKPDPSQVLVYRERLRYELSVLRDMGFANYFLLVQDIVRWSKSNGILVGPGRGSVGGSLVAYLLGITDVDPIRFNLFFERFINPERQDLPDADLDFMSTKRHLVVEYLRDKYGADHVAGISNYSTLASASALRDTGRVFGYEPAAMSCTKLVPKEHGTSFTLDEAADAVPEIDKFKGENPDLWIHATRLEGAMRSFGQHAAGVVVAGEPIINRAVIERRTGGLVVNWDRNSVESWGLVKVDILGLSTLDTLEMAQRYIQERHGIKIDYLDLPLDDADVMEAFGKGTTSGVFQFDSPGMKKLLQSLALGGQLTFEDITAATALYRPGPIDSGLLDDFVAIKQGVQEIIYDHPNMEPCLNETYGIMVYQEQVMQVARDLSGFTMAEADNLRKAIGKKDKEKMASMREKFVDGALSVSGMPNHYAEELWAKIELYASYSFNKSHSVEYSIISMWTMWLKVRYPIEFIAASLTVASDKGGDDRDTKVMGLVKVARELAIEVMPPDINRSTGRFEIADDKTLYAPFQAIKGVSENTTGVILAARAKADAKVEVVFDDGSAKCYKINVVFKTEEDGVMRPIGEIAELGLTPVLNDK